MNAELWVTRSHLAGEGAKPDKAAEYAGGLTISPQDYATNAAQSAMLDPSNGNYTREQIARCKARPEQGGNPNIYVVDEYGPNNQPEDSYRDACGPYGLMAGESQYWQLGQNDAWFFFPRFQDAMQDFDRSSITFVKKNAAGQWMRDTNPGQMMASATQVSDDYEVADIAGDPAAREALYDTARDYNVYSASVNGAFRYCVGERVYGNFPFRIGFDGGQWQVAVIYSTKPDYYGSYEVDGSGRGMSGTSKNGWTFWWLGAPELDQLRNGSTVIMNIDRASVDFPLTGSAATITKVEECVHRKGKR